MLGAAPIVLALARPRAAAFDGLLDEQDLDVVAVAPGAHPALARLAVGGPSARCGLRNPAGAAPRKSSLAQTDIDREPLIDG